MAAQLARSTSKSAASTLQRTTSGKKAGSGTIPPSARTPGKTLVPPPPQMSSAAANSSSKVIVEHIVFECSSHPICSRLNSAVLLDSVQPVSHRCWSSMRGLPGAIGLRGYAGGVSVPTATAWKAWKRSWGVHRNPACHQSGEGNIWCTSRAPAHSCTARSSFKE